jgi:hypothetical protein
MSEENVEIVNRNRVLLCRLGSSHRGTPRFSPEALNLADRQRIVAIDGRRFAELMIDAGVGVAPLRIYALTEIDEDYFSDGSGGGATPS